MNTELLNRRTASRRTRRGANAVEFALTAPIFFAIIIGAMDFGWFFAHQLVLDHSAFEAARVASMAIETQDSASTANSDWEQHGKDTWNRYGLPGEPTFNTRLTSSGGQVLVHITGTVDYAPFGAWDDLLGTMGLPESIVSTHSRRTGTQFTLDAEAGP